jgi:hypothetical protein
MKTVDFKTSPYFSGTILFVAGVFALVAVVVITASMVTGIIMLTACLAVFTTHYRLRIDFEKKVYHDYVWIFGMNHGEKGKFETIEYLFIKKNKVSQTMNLRVASSTIRKDVYDGYLKFSENHKLHLITKDNKKDLAAKLDVISRQLKVKVIDYSVMQQT